MQSLIEMFATMEAYCIASFCNFNLCAGPSFTVSSIAFALFKSVGNYLSTFPFRCGVYGATYSTKTPFAQHISFKGAICSFALSHLTVFTRIPLAFIHCNCLFGIAVVDDFSDMT
jgi:hypothetical protein